VNEIDTIVPAASLLASTKENPQFMPSLAECSWVWFSGRQLRELAVAQK